MKKTATEIQKDTKREKLAEWSFIGAVFLFTFLWAACQPFDVSPDERMRYEIVQYLCEYGRLPHGGDPALRNEIWGISYAFNPIISYMLSAVFVKLAGLFTDNGMALVIAARMVNVLFTAGTAFLTLKIGKQMLTAKGRWLFAVLVSFLPGFLFVGSYVNNDAMALFSTAWICYAWVRYLAEGWSVKNCIWLGIGLSLCLLSYYNAYGWVLVSFLFFSFTTLFCEGKPWNVSLWLRRGLIVAAVAVIMAGWWFLRNAILYHGDFLGMKTSSWYAQQYAQPDYKPSNRLTPQRQGYSIWGMLWIHPGTWPHNWIITVLVSFVGTFGYMTVFMPYTLSKLYWLLFLIGGAGVFLTPRICGFRKTYTWKSQILIGETPVTVTSTGVAKEWDKRRIFHAAMLLAAAIPPVLLLQYSWSSDFQAQGRYLLPMILPMMYFIARGYENLLSRFVKKERVKSGLYLTLSLLLILAALYTFLYVVIPFFTSSVLPAAG